MTWADRYGGFWVVSRYADIITALMDPVTFSSTEGVHIPRQEGQMKSIPIDYDPPIHTRYRKIFNDALNLRLIRSHEPVIRSVIVQLLAPIVAKGGGELVSELAIQLPIRVISGVAKRSFSIPACWRGRLVSHGRRAPYECCPPSRGVS